MGEREYFMEARRQKAKHQAHVAELMGNALSLMMYQTEATHGAHELQTKLVMALGQAKSAAEELAREFQKSAQS